MLAGQQVSGFTIFRGVCVAMVLLLLGASCTMPRKYQAKKPFVYKTTISVHDKTLRNAEKKELRDALYNQLDDSLRTQTTVTFGFAYTFPLFYNVLEKPAVFDTLSVERSRSYVNALLNARGYFSPALQDTFYIDTVVKRKKGDQYRVYVKLDVYPGVAHRLDSIGYALTTPALQQLAMENREGTYLKKGEPYSINNIANELDRLVNIYRNHGYYKIGREDIYAEQDTVVAALIDPTLDPFEQIRLLDSLQKKKDHPTINLVIKQRVPKDSNHLDIYHIGRVNVYPDLSLGMDTSKMVARQDSIGGLHFFSYTNHFKLPFIAKRVPLTPGDLYRQNDYYKTINTFNQLGPWQQTSVDLIERPDTIRLLDADIRLYPARKQSLNVDLETSRNVGDFLTTNSLFGIGLTVGLLNRNAFREAIQTSSNARFGIELGAHIIQTLQASFNHRIYFPKFISPIRLGNPDNIRTVVNFNTSYTNRRDFFDVRSFNASWGYESTRRNHRWQYIPFNFEYTDLNKTDSLDHVIEKIPSLAYAFKNGLIISQILTYSTGKITDRHVSVFRASVEESGALTGMFKNIDRGDLRRFIKLESEYSYVLNGKSKKSAWAFRIFGGYGHAYGKNGDEDEQNLPFFKAFYAGGPYSMRAWQVRRLGLGSNILYDTATGGPYDRFGDIKLEGNVEYRFDIATIAGIKVKSQFFLDMGNIWAKLGDESEAQYQNANFKLSRLYRDIAVGGGTGLSLDFSFFLLRFDWAYQLKNPLYANENDGWFRHIDISSGQFQLGIGYAF